MRSAAAVAAVAVLTTTIGLAGPVPAAAAGVPVRYLDEVFTSVTVTTDITYGQSLNQAGQMQSLELDLYEPAGDPLAQRPLIVWIHGGSFAYGSKSGGWEQQQGNALARRGFVVASIEYRLAPEPISPETMYATEGLIAIGQAYNDARKAVTFLRANAAAYGIDPDVILGSGYSAGGVTAAHLALMPNRSKGFGTATDPGHVDGALIYAGATPSGFVEAGEPPLLWFHGTADTTVPHQMALDTHDVAVARGLDSTFVSKPGASHDLSSYREEFRETIGAWAYDRWLAPTPNIAGLDVHVSPWGVAQPVRITGAGFSRATGVQFGAVPATSFTVVDDTTIDAVAPVAAQASLVQVWVTGPGGTSPAPPGSVAALLRFDGPPRVGAVSPNLGTTAGGGTVTVRGAGFLGTTEVRFGGAPASFTVVNDQLLNVVAPPRPAGPGLVNVWVTDALGTNTNQTSSWYSYQ